MQRSRRNRKNRTDNRTKNLQHKNETRTYTTHPMRNDRISRVYVK